MERLQAKQIDKVVDLDSHQQIMGRKTFLTPQWFASSNNKQIAISDGFIYWCLQLDQLEEEGNCRLSLDSGYIIVEIYENGKWRIS